jgi:hypothetical protein
MAGWAARFLDGPVVEDDDEDHIYGSGGVGPPDKVWMAWDEDVGWVIGESEDEGAVSYRLVRSGIRSSLPRRPALIGYGDRLLQARLTIFAWTISRRRRSAPGEWAPLVARLPRHLRSPG